MDLNSMGWLAWIILGGMAGFNMYTFLVAVLGATILLWLFNLIRKRR